MQHITPANTDEYQHHLCEIIIRFLYGADADVEQYKVYHGDSHAFDRLKGVDVEQFDYTNEKDCPQHKVLFNDKVAQALAHAKFSAKYGDKFMHDEGDSLFKATIESKAYKHQGINRSVLCVYPK